MKVKRERTVRLQVLVTEDEAEKIKRNMRLTGASNFSLYARKMLLDGYVVRMDFKELRDVSAALGYLARNLHQVARRANETRSVYAEDLEKVRESYYKDFGELKKRLVSLIKKSGG